MIGSAPTSTLTGVPGWESPAEQQLLKKYAQRVPAGGLILEIGCEYGMSTSIFRKFSPASAQIHCVEINPDAPFIQNLQAANLNFNIADFRMPSQQFFNMMGSVAQMPPKYHLIFVDGDHHYEGALFDLRSAFRFLAPNGVILIHDIAVPSNKLPHEQHYEVLQAYRDAVRAWPDFDIVESADTCAVVQRVRNG